MNRRFLFLDVFIIGLIVLVLLVLPFDGTNSVDAEIVSITVLHTNDVHGRVREEESVAMGYAHIAAKVEEIRSANENVLLLDAGDTFQGSSAAGLYRGEGIVRIMNSMNYDAMVAGDHDFDYGWQRLWEFAEVTDFPVLSANVFGSDGIELLLPLTIKELNGISIGIFGLTTPETLYKTNPLNVEGLTIIDPIEKAQEMVEILHDKCDLIIALVHLPLMGTEDSCVSLTEKVKGIDLIVSGHSHVTLEEGNGWLPIHNQRGIDLQFSQ
jgi:2',3'-cyclic-nucleotide 2'-phosphodiesterase (5'-nucleotidase family)